MTTEHEHEQDLVLEALFAAARELSTSLPKELIISSYEIQRSHQFDSEEKRETSLQELEKLVNGHLELSSDQ